MKEHIFEYDDMFTEPLGLPHFPKEEIVRCRDCSWFCEGSDVFATSDWCQNFDCETNDDGYCAWSKRRAEA